MDGLMDKTTLQWDALLAAFQHALYIVPEMSISYRADAESCIQCFAARRNQMRYV